MKRPDETERQITVDTPSGPRVFTVYVSVNKDKGVVFVTFGPDRRTCMLMGLQGGPMFLTSDPVMLNTIQRIFDNYCLVDLCKTLGGKTDGEKKESERGSEPPTVP